MAMPGGGGPGLGGEWAVAFDSNGTLFVTLSPHRLLL
jgi:hypothetical protein